MQVKQAKCPTALLLLDKNASVLWPKLLKRAKVTVSDGEVIEDRRGWITMKVGLPDLIFRLESQSQREKNGVQDEVARARIWFHVAEACTPGDSIPDVGGDNRFLLNPWIVTSGLKFPNPRFESLRQIEKLQQPTKQRNKRKRASRKAKEAVWASRTPIFPSSESRA